MTLQSTISDSSDDHSDKDDLESYPKSDQVVNNHTSDRNERKVIAAETTKSNSAQTLSTSGKILSIIPAIIPPGNKTIVDGVATSGRTLYAVCAFLHKDIVTGATRSAARVLKYPPVVN